MAATNPKGQAYFQRLLNKPGSSAPQPRKEAKVVESISRVEAILDNTNVVVVEPPKKSRKRDKGSRRSHFSLRRHRHGVGNSSQPLIESLFGASTRFSNFVHTNLDGLLRHMFL